MNVVQARWSMLPVAGLLAPAAHAGGDWSMQYNANLYTQSETNPTLAPTDAKDAQSGVLDAGLALQRRTERTAFSLTAGGEVRRYDQDVALDRNQQQLNATWTAAGELSQFAATVGLTRDTTLTSELGTTGFTQDNLRHREYTVTMSPSWYLSERTTAGLSAGWQQTRYQQGEGSALVDYRYRFVGANADWSLSEKAGLTLQGTVSRLNSRGYDFATDSANVQLQLQYQWSPRWSGLLAAGPSWVKTAGLKKRGQVYAGTLSRKAELATLSLSLKRSVDPSGRGLLSRRDDASLNLAAQLSEHVDGSVGASLIRSRDYVPSFGFTLSEVTYARADAAMYWQFAQDWSLGVTAGGAKQRQKEWFFYDVTGRGFNASLRLAWHRTSPLG